MVLSLLLASVCPPAIYMYLSFLLVIAGKFSFLKMTFLALLNPAFSMKITNISFTMVQEHFNIISAGP